MKSFKRVQVYLTAVMLSVSFIAEAQRTIPMNIERLVKDAGLIVHAKVSKVESGIDSQSGLTVTWVTLQVKENLYGAPASECTFKQYGGKSGRIVHSPIGMPRYAVGEEMVLMLTAPSQVGMQSPVGMEQGKYRVSNERGNGKKIVTNGMENKNLFVGVKNTRFLGRMAKANPQNPGPLGLEDFKNMVRLLVQNLKTGETLK
jgi:hypothetical protein